jgi:hypothetical protein
MRKPKITSYYALILFALSPFVYFPPLQAAEDLEQKDKIAYVLEESASVTEEDPEENSSEALEMIALRMKSLSSSLNEMPEIPQLDQTIQLPLSDPEETKEDSKRHPEQSEGS